MRPFFYLLLLCAIISGTLFVSCVTEESPEPEQPAAVVEEPAPEPVSEPEPVPEQVPEPEPDQIPEPAEEVAQEEEPPEEPVSETEDFVVSEDMYEKTFTDIETLIKELNSIIKAENYDIWTTYLTQSYKSSLEDPNELSRISEEPILKKYNIRLNTLKDYFLYVVVPSRSDARLDDIVFVDESHVKAIMVINKRRSILYKLEKIDDKWKIGDF